MDERHNYEDLVRTVMGGKDAHELSRATSPGGEPPEVNGVEDDDYKKYRTRPRTYPYFQYLPYEVETEAQRQHNLGQIIKYLYIAVEAGDFSPGAVHWTRELRSWLSLKFDPTKEQRVRLVRLYYELALAPGIDPTVSDRFASMFMLLTKKKHYLRPNKDLTLDWKPMYREFKQYVLPTESGTTQLPSLKRSMKTLIKMCSFAQLYYDPNEIPEMLETILPFFSTSFSEGAFVVVGLLNLLLPTHAASATEKDLWPQQFLPTYYHLWALVNRSKTFDVTFIDLFSRMARDSLQSSHVPFSEFGIFTRDQSILVYTGILRLLEIPVGQSTSPYSAVVDLSRGLGILLERDHSKHPASHHIARWIVMSLSPACVTKKPSMLSMLEGLIQAIETFFHPSNSGAWSRTLAQLVYYLADFFVIRWNREHNGEMDIAPERHLDEAVKNRFVICLRDVVFMGIYAKSGTAMNYSLSTLQSLAYLAPDLVLPGALQRIYPSMQGLVEVHRTTSSLRSLQILARTMIRSKGYRCHISPLLGLALPGIDANDLEKSLITLSFIATVCYNIPFADLSESTENVHGEEDAHMFITGEVARFQAEGANVTCDYDTMDNDLEKAILASSTTAFSSFVSSFLGKVFTLLENLPDASRVRSGSPEENIVNTLPAAFTPLFAALSPEIYEMALDKIVDFVSNHVIHQARDAMAFICNCLCKVNPKKALAKLVPVLVAAIRVEIDENGAGSTRNSAADVLPRDRGLVWNISMLSMCVVHVGAAVLEHEEELFNIANYMQQKCKGMTTVHVSNFVHHLLLNLTMTYTADVSLYEPGTVPDVLTTEQWGLRTPVDKIRPRWHVPNRAEIEFALRLFKNQAGRAMTHLRALITGTSPIKRDGSGKDWSDEVSRNLVLIRLTLSGVSVLFDSKGVSAGLETTSGSEDDSQANGHPPEMSESEESDEDEDSKLDITDEQKIKPSFQYPAGCLLDEDDDVYEELHEMRQQVGRALHFVHQYLVKNAEDDVSSFAPLYTAYRTWFVDVGIERSAHVLDRVTRLLSADEQPYKVSGIRKDYPRSVLIKRANVYHLQRLRHNAAPRPRSELDQQLLLDLAESSISLYIDIRKNAQSASESALKVIFGSRLVIIPPLLRAFQKAVREDDFARIKGGFYSLLFSSLAKTLGRHWKYTPTVIRTFIEAISADKPSIQKLITAALIQIMDYGRPLERMAILDEEIVKGIASGEDLSDKIEKKRKHLARSRAIVESKKAALAKELYEQVQSYHWKKASRTVTVIMSLCMRFDTIVPDEFLKIIVAGSLDPHPGLRGMYASTLSTFFTMIDARAVNQHDYAKYIQGLQEFPAKIDVAIDAEKKGWTEKYLADFAQPKAEYYIDHDYPGWLVWGKKMPAYRANLKRDIEYDEVEWSKRKVIGQCLNRGWFKGFFGYLKQEPRDPSADKFRMTSAMTLLYAFELMLRDGLTVVTFEEIKEETLLVFEDGSDRHQHRATAEILAGLFSSVIDSSVDARTEVWEFAFPIVRKVFSDGLTPENSGYWTTFLHMILQGRDPRRAWPLVDYLTKFRLDMSSNSATKESSKINLLHQLVIDAGWHFQMEKPVVHDFLGHIDHPYKAVREAIGQTLSTIFRSRYHESFKNVRTLVKAQRDCSSIGEQPYKPDENFVEIMEGVFSRLEQWRKERPPGSNQPSAYTSGSKTVVLLLDSMLSSEQCTLLLQFFPNLFTEQFLHMMDVKEDPELQSLAYHVFRHIPNIPQPINEDKKMIDTLIRIGQTSASWHQRLRVMINMQITFFRRLFELSEIGKQKLFDCVASMLEDTQHEVRAGAAATLSGMIRCSPIDLREDMVQRLRKRFMEMLDKNPLPKKPKKGRAPELASIRSSGTNTPTPEHQRLVITRHAAVLGLGALVQAFPYSSPPPSWIPEVLITMSNKAGADSGNVGSTVKTTISDFKKTRQDTWHIDQTAFTPEQLEDLSGVLWKSYFA